MNQKNLIAWFKIFLWVYVVFIGARGLWVNGKVLHLYYQLQKEVVVAQNFQAELVEKRQKLDNPVYMEMLIRKKLGLVKSGEIVYKILKKE
jgi:cell division protein FtsB